MLSLSRRFPLVSPNNTIEIRVGPFKTDSEATDSGEQLYDITMFHSLLKNVCKFREKIPSIQILADNRGLEFLLNCGKNLRFPSTQLHTNLLKFESEISPKNGVQNGVRFEKMPLRVSERHFQWRWADSNRRPNTAPDSFLHVYSFFVCRLESAGRQAKTSLSFKSWQGLKESPCASGLDDTPYSGHNRPKARRDTRRSRSLGGRRLS